MRVALDLAVPSDVGQIERVVARVVATCADLHVPHRHLQFSVPLALTEALSNAILYGNREELDRQVRVRAGLERHALILEVTDEGPGFDLDACTRDPTAPENLEREDGRGLFLMRRLMDRVERYTDEGNVVRMVLELP